LDLKRLSTNEFDFQNPIKIEVALVEPPPLKAPPYAVFFTGSAHPNIKVKQAS
jgi:hypothetical protein